ncbi:hematopoietic SH2 domain-containing protein homolog [Diretmus argenteus]
MEGGQSQEQHDTASTWFTEFQLQSVIRNGIVPEWFHGIISRKTAEDLLLSKPPGYFLIRVSESRFGYTLSYRVEDRCRHFMIDVLKDGYYVIVGENTRHRFLQDLVDFHCRTPIMPFNEMLTVPCGQISKDKADYAELLFPKRLPVPLPRKRYIANTTQPEQPPELPARSFKPPQKQNQTCTRTNFALESPSALGRLATGQEDDHPHSASSQSARNQDVKPAVVLNLINLKKKFQKMRSASQEHMYAEIGAEAEERHKGRLGGSEVKDKNESTENEYQELPAEQTINGVPFSNPGTTMILIDSGLPQEYLQPPPFAPGY